tara:strand:+ start:27 stop:593 length:567 start_codon:yes stop_codon:yes gene_type:complete
MSHTPDDKAELSKEIAAAIQKVAEEKELHKVKSLSRHNPDKVAEILYLHSKGVSQTRMVRKYGIHRNTIIQVLVDYADHLGNLRDLAGRMAAMNYVNLTSLEEDLVSKVRDRMDDDPEMKVGFRDLKEISIAKANAFRETMTTRGEATRITEERKVYTQEDYEATVQAAKDRLNKAKIIEADVEDVSE